MDRHRLGGTVRFVGVVGIAGLIVALSVEVRSLRGSHRQVQRMKSFPTVGQWVPTTRAATTTGDSVTIGETEPGRAQLLIAFSTACEYCLATLPRWKQVTDSLLRDERRRFDVVWISSSSWDSTRAYAARHGLTAPIVKLPTAKLSRVFKINAVPLTIVLDRWGRVEHTHVSVLNSKTALDSVLAAASRAASADSIWAAMQAPP